MCNGLIRRDRLKLLFLWRILNLRIESVYRSVFLLRFFHCLTNTIYTNVSPVAQMIDLCVRYNVLNDVLDMIFCNTVYSKQSWKTHISTLIVQKEFVNWRFDLKLYNHLSVFKSVILKIEMCVWWEFVKFHRPLKRACCTMIRLLLVVTVYV